MIRYKILSEYQITYFRTSLTLSNRKGKILFVLSNILRILLLCVSCADILIELFLQKDNLDLEWSKVCLFNFCKSLWRSVFHVNSCCQRPAASEVKSLDLCILQRDQLIHMEHLIEAANVKSVIFQVFQEHGVYPGLAWRLSRLQSHGLHVSIVLRILRGFSRLCCSILF